MSGAAQKTAVVTGAARGIGLATTRAFLAEGWRVVMIDRDAPALEEAAAPLAGVDPVVCDVSQPGQVDQMAAYLAETTDRLDALVNNAGVADFGPIAETDFARWRTVMETNRNPSGQEKGVWVVLGVSESIGEDMVASVSSKVTAGDDK